MTHYQGLVIDRMGTLPTRRTKWHATWEQAQIAAERLCRRCGWMSRARIAVVDEDGDC